MLKKGLFCLFCLLFLVSFISAQTYKLEISPTKDIFESGEEISFKVTLLDAQNNPLKDQVSIVIEDAEKNIKIEKSVSSNEIININTGERTSYGQGTITAEYKEEKAIGIFNININELAKFDLSKDQLTITNIGNTQYTRTVQIIIGTTTGTQYPKLAPRESISYKLVAPEGNYQIKVSDGKTTETWGNIPLSGTGQVIGAIDQTQKDRNSITGGIRPGEEDEMGIMGYMKNNKFTYVFVFMIFGAMILLAIEKRYRKKI